MEKLTLILEEIVAVAVADIKSRQIILKSHQHFQDYLSVLKPAIERYRHHNGNAINQADIEGRYQYETALLHVLTQLFLHHRHKFAKLHSLIWPVYEANSFYSWYSLPQSLSTRIKQLAHELEDIENIRVALFQGTGDLLDRTGKRYLGEFYTPPQLVNHLIDLSGFHGRDLIQGKKAVDPACGGGAILAEIAEKVVSEALDDSPQNIVDALSNNLYGFDIQPFAIILTKSLLLYICLPLIKKARGQALIPTFPNIQLLDPLVAYRQFWGEHRFFDYIIGNPPFMSIKKDCLDYIQAYEDAVYGHPNLYGLFVWWALQAAKHNGVVSFLLPQSLLAGNYYLKLREQVNKKADLLGMTRMIDRKGVVQNVDQQMMVISFRITDSQPLREDITVRVTRNGTDIGEAISHTVRYPRVVRKIDDYTIWVVSEHSSDYVIAERLEAACLTLAQFGDRVRLGNGGYVWNQHKELLLAQQEEISFPLISAASIAPYTVKFPYVGSHPSHKRPFSRVDASVQVDIHEGPALLVQRTTPTKVGRRLVAGLLTDDFCSLYPQYFLENHVNYIQSTSNDNQSFLYGLAGWLNSDVINFLFQLRNGTTHVSLFELELLPINLDVLMEIASHVQMMLENPSETRLSYINKMNAILFDWLKLGTKQRSRIETVLSRREKATPDRGKPKATS